MDGSILRLAARQHGVVARRQLLALGIPADTVRSLVRRRTVEVLAVGVYGVRGAPATPHREAVVAALRCGPDAVVVGERVLAFLGLRELRLDGPLTVLTRSGRRISNVPWPTRTDPRGATRRPTWVGGVPSLPPPDLLVESCVDVSASTVERFVDAYRWSRFDLAAVRRAVALDPTHPGAVVLRSSGLIDLDAGESPPERTMFELVQHLGAVRQHRVLPDAVVDVYIPPGRLALEYQGRSTHDGPRAVVRDAGRIARIEATGVRVEPVFAADLRDPAAFVHRIERLVAYRTAVAHP